MITYLYLFCLLDRECQKMLFDGLVPRQDVLLIQIGQQARVVVVTPTAQFGVLLSVFL